VAPEILNAIPKEADKMEKWLNVVETYPEPPSKEDEFNDWYSNIHVPDAVGSPDYVGAVRYVSPSPVITNGRGRYLALYYMETDDLERTMNARLQKRKVEITQNRHTDTCVNTWRDVLYREIGWNASQTPPTGGSRWVNLIEMNCDPKREDEFVDWFTNVYLPQMTETEGVVEAVGYVHREFRDGRGKYLTVFQIDSDDLDRTISRFEQWHQKVLADDPRAETARMMWDGLLFKKIMDHFPDK
jgi:hypothetical protein